MTEFKLSNFTLSLHVGEPNNSKCHLQVFTAEGMPISVIITSDGVVPSMEIWVDKLLHHVSIHEIECGPVFSTMPIAKKAYDLALDDDPTATLTQRRQYVARTLLFDSKAAGKHVIDFSFDHIPATEEIICTYYTACTGISDAAEGLFRVRFVADSAEVLEVD